jgi:type IV pilus assembly protein PilN
MIRINLLPIRKEQQRESSRRQLILFAVIIALECVALYPLFATKDSELGEVQTEIQAKQAQIAKLKIEAQDVEKLTTEKNQLEAQLAVLDKLEAGRSGPVRILDNLQKILSSPRNDLERLEFEKRGWNPRWDPTRLWLNDFSEAKGGFELSGGARTADDVAEFLQRLSSSVYFDEVRLLSSEEASTKDFLYTKFGVEGQVSYTVSKDIEQGEKG